MLALMAICSKRGPWECSPSAHSGLLLLFLSDKSSWKHLQICGSSIPGMIVSHQCHPTLSLCLAEVMCCMSTRSMLLKRVESRITGTLTSQHKCLYQCKNPVTILTCCLLRKRLSQDLVSQIHFYMTFSYRSSQKHPSRRTCAHC